MDRALSTALLIVAWASGAGAQTATSSKAALLSFVDGDVTVEAQPIAAGKRFLSLDREQSVVTSAGRAEILLNPCLVFHLDENSSLRVLSNRLDDTRVALTSGSALVRADGILRHTNASVNLGSNVVPLMNRGVYGFDASPPHVRVFKGQAVADRPGLGPLKLTSGREADLASTAMPRKFNADQQAGAFGRWSVSRAVTLLLESGYNEAAERDRERRERAWRYAETAGRHRPGTLPPTFDASTQGRLRFCEEASIR